MISSPFADSDCLDFTLVEHISATLGSDEASLTRAGSLVECSRNCVLYGPCIGINWQPEAASCELLIHTRAGLSLLEQQPGIISAAVKDGPISP